VLPPDFLVAVSPFIVLFVLWVLEEWPNQPIAAPGLMGRVS